MPLPRAAVSSATCEVAGPLGERASARMLVDVECKSAVIEMAEAAGIGYSPCTESAALAATTYGVGELMLRAVRMGAKTLYIGLGGSATNDGGAGMLQALGARVVDDQDCDVAPGLAGLEQVASIDLAPALQCTEMALVSLCFRMSRIRSWDAAAHWRCLAGRRACRRMMSEALRRYDGWMVGYGRLLDAAITGAASSGVVARARGRSDIWLGARCARRRRRRWPGCRAAGARGGAAFGRGDGARPRGV